MTDRKRVSDGAIEAFPAKHSAEITAERDLWFITIPILEQRGILRGFAVPDGVVAK